MKPTPEEIKQMKQNKENKNEYVKRQIKKQIKQLEIQINRKLKNIKELTEKL